MLLSGAVPAENPVHRALLSQFPQLRMAETRVDTDIIKVSDSVLAEGGELDTGIRKLVVCGGRENMGQGIADTMKETLHVMVT